MLYFSPTSWSSPCEGRPEIRLSLPTPSANSSSARLFSGSPRRREDKSVRKIIDKIQTKNSKRRFLQAVWVFNLLGEIAVDDVVLDELLHFTLGRGTRAVRAGDVMESLPLDWQAFRRVVYKSFQAHVAQFGAVFHRGAAQVEHVNVSRTRAFLVDA